MAHDRFPGRGALLALLVVCSLVPRLAAAQSSSAEAEQLFREGKRLMKEGKYAEACTAFEASQEAAASTSTLVNLADCREKNGQLASAWGLFLDVEHATRSDSKQAGLNKTAADRAKKLEPRISYLTVSVPEESKIDGLELTRNGDPLPIGSWNRAIPVDGGDYVIGGRAPGHEEWSTKIHVENEGAHVSVDVPKFKVVEELIQQPDKPPPAEDEPEPEGEVLTDTPSSFTGQRKLALGVAGVGVVAAGAGIVLGLQAKGFQDDAAALCPTQTGCARADEANALVDKSNQRALFADIGYGVAAAAVVGAAILWFTGAPDEAPAEVSLAPVVGPTATGFALVGSF